MVRIVEESVLVFSTRTLARDDVVVRLIVDEPKWRPKLGQNRRWRFVRAFLRIYWWAPPYTQLLLYKLDFPIVRILLLLNNAAAQTSATDFKDTAEHLSGIVFKERRPHRFRDGPTTVHERQTSVRDMTTTVDYGLHVAHAKNVRSGMKIETLNTFQSFSETNMLTFSPRLLMKRTEVPESCERDSSVVFVYLE